MVRGKPRRLPVRPGAQRAAGRGDRRRSLPRPRRWPRRAAQPARRFKDFQWTTRDSWSRRRRVIGKAEWTQGEANPRFIVTSLTRARRRARHLYEEIYCARGEMENRIKECQLDLFADRTSAATMRANQLRLWFASMAYVLLCALRRIGLAGNQVRRCHLRHHPPQAAQDRRAGPHHRPPHQDRHGLGLPSSATGATPPAAWPTPPRPAPHPSDTRPPQRTDPAASPTDPHGDPQKPNHQRLRRRPPRAPRSNAGKHHVASQKQCRAQPCLAIGGRQGRDACRRSHGAFRPLPDIWALMSSTLERNSFRIGDLFALL